MTQIPSVLFFFLIFTFGFSTVNPEIGSIIDTHNGIPIYFNGKTSNTFGRHITKDGYNLGLKYQCVEYVKRYYYEIYDHKMPQVYGHAKDYFKKELDDVAFNEDRGLWQYRNIRYEKPQIDDIVIFGATKENPYGHMGIVTQITDTEIEIIQQNWGDKTRHTMKLVYYKGIWNIADFDVLGWLRR